MKLAQIAEAFAEGRLPLRFSAYDGSSAGPADATMGLDLVTPRGTTYLATAPNQLGLPKCGGFTWQPRELASSTTYFSCTRCSG